MTEKKTTAVAKPYDLVNNTARQLREYQAHNQLVLPADYSIENALKSAWLILQETVDRDKHPVLQTCSQASIANALLDMAVQALNPGKKQCYFIAFGKKLVCLRSYFGSMALAERVASAKNIWAEVVYSGDEFEYEIRHNQKVITKHTQKLENIKSGSITAAYCIIEFSNSRPDYCEIMIIDQIKAAWKKSQTDSNAPGSVHSQYPEEMCKRTVINRACKKIINSSSDDNLFLESFQRADDEVTEAQVAEEIGEKANQDFIDVVPETGEIVENLPMSEVSFKTSPKTKTKPKRDPASIKTIGDLTKACFEEFGLQPAQVVKELGYGSLGEIAELPKDCYLKIVAVRAEPKEEAEEEPEF